MASKNFIKCKSYVGLLHRVLIFLLLASCNNNNSEQKKEVSDSSAKDQTVTPITQQVIVDSMANKVDSTIALSQSKPDSMLSQLKNITSLFGKPDSGIINNTAFGNNMDSMLGKLQSMMGNKSDNVSDGIAKSILNFQLGQMSNDNPLKSVANGMLAAQKNGTAGPSKVYSAKYNDEQPADYSMPVSGNGNTIILQYTGGSIVNNKKDGLWKNVYVSTNKEAKWNMYSESYAESSAINMKVHTTSLASVNENYSINMNDQYKKYNNLQKSDLGKNESGVQVEKIGNEKMFGYNCVHVRISYSIKALGQTATMQDDEWCSSDVPGSLFLSPLVFENHSPAVVKKIMDAGCSGVLVKSVIKSAGSFQLVQLSRIIQKDMPDSMFTLPANYQEDKNTAVYNIQ